MSAAGLIPIPQLQLLQSSAQKYWISLLIDKKLRQANLIFKHV